MWTAGSPALDNIGFETLSLPMCTREMVLVVLRDCIWASSGKMKFNSLITFSLLFSCHFLVFLLSLSLFLSSAAFVFLFHLYCLVCTCLVECFCSSIAQENKYKASSQHGSPWTIHHLLLSRTDQFRVCFSNHISEVCHSQLARVAWEERLVGVSAQMWHWVNVMAKKDGEIPKYYKRK